MTRPQRRPEGRTVKSADTTKAVHPDLRFPRNQQLPGNTDYVIVDKNQSARARQAPAEYLNRGQVGVVYRAVYKKQLQRVIKFLNPRQNGDEQARLPLEYLEKNFQQEIALLSKITHTNICKIVDFGTFQPRDTGFPYYVMEFIDGETLSDFLKHSDARTFLKVLCQLTEAIDYLHKNGYYHMDVTVTVVAPTITFRGGAEPLRTTGRRPASSCR